MNPTESITPRRKPTAQEHAERIDFVAARVARTCTRSEIHSAFRKRWAWVHWKTIDNYIVRAREQLRRQASMSKDDAKQIGLGVILGVMKEGKPIERIRAEERLAAIMGYDAPKRTEVSGPGGLPIQSVDVSLNMNEIRDRVRVAVEGEEAVKLMEARGLLTFPEVPGKNGGNGNGNGNGNGE